MPPPLAPLLSQAMSDTMSSRERGQTGAPTGCLSDCPRGPAEWRGFGQKSMALQPVGRAKRGPCVRPVSMSYANSLCALSVPVVQLGSMSVANSLCALSAWTVAPRTCGGLGGLTRARAREGARTRVCALPCWRITFSGDLRRSAPRLSGGGS